MYALGIDLGTTFTAAAVWRDGRAQIVSLGGRGAAIPSVVLLREDETFLTGEAANRRGLTEPNRVAREFKRRLGDTTPILLGGTPQSAESLMSQLLRAVVSEVVTREGGPPSTVCVSHPANWGPYKIDLLRQAVRMADLPSVSFATEPEAAAVNYAREQRLGVGAVVAVYDLGGGTFDAAVLRRTANGFAILGEPEGIERLGGIDFDAAVFNHVRNALGTKLDDLDEDDAAAIAAVARLREECVAAKEALSADTDTAIPVLLPSVTTEVRLTRGELEAMVRPALHGSIEALQRAVRSADLSPDELHSVLLVGGSSRMPIVGQLVSAELGRPVAVDTHPKHAVALGAAWLAGGGMGGVGGGMTSVVPAAGGPGGPGGQGAGGPGAGGPGGRLGGAAAGAGFAAGVGAGMAAGGDRGGAGAAGVGRAGGVGHSAAAAGQAGTSATGHGGSAAAGAAGGAAGAGGQGGAAYGGGAAGGQAGATHGGVGAPGSASASGGRSAGPTAGGPANTAAGRGTDYAGRDAGLGAGPAAGTRPGDAGLGAGPRPGGDAGLGAGTRPGGEPGFGAAGARPGTDPAAGTRSEGGFGAGTRSGEAGFGADPGVRGGSRGPSSPPGGFPMPSGPPTGTGGRAAGGPPSGVGGMPPVGREAPVREPLAPPDDTGDKRRRILIGASGVIVLAVLAAVAVALNVFGGEEPQPRAGAAGQTSSVTPTDSLPADEQCTDEIMSNTNWVCLTSAIVADGKITIDYRSDGSKFNVKGGVHLHIFGSDGTESTEPKAGVMGRQVPESEQGEWYNADGRPVVLSVDDERFKLAIGDAKKVCARISDGEHMLVPDENGTYLTGNCVPVTRTGSTETEVTENTQPPDDGHNNPPTWDPDDPTAPSEPSEPTVPSDPPTVDDPPTVEEPTVPEGEPAGP